MQRQYASRRHIHSRRARTAVLADDRAERLWRYAGLIGMAIGLAAAFGMLAHTHKAHASDLGAKLYDIEKFRPSEGKSAGSGVFDASKFGTPEFLENNMEESKSCSPHSQALLSQVELMRAAAPAMQSRWEEQGFGTSPKAVEARQAFEQGSFMMGGQVQAGQPGMIGGGPADIRRDLNGLVNGVNPIAPDYSRFYSAHPNMQRDMEQAKAMGLGPGAVHVDPQAVARQFGIAYDGGWVENKPFDFIPPNTGSVFSRLALHVRSLFY